MEFQSVLCVLRDIIRIKPVNPIVKVLLKEVLERVTIRNAAVVVVDWGLLIKTIVRNVPRDKNRHQIFQGCLDCENGHYEENHECRKCPANTYQLPGVTKQSGIASCITCPAGTDTQSDGSFIDLTGTGTCLACRTGLKQIHQPEKTCASCTAGKFSHNMVPTQTVTGYGDTSFTEEMCQAYAAKAKYGVWKSKVGDC